MGEQRVCERAVRRTERGCLPRAADADALAGRGRRTHMHMCMQCSSNSARARDFRRRMQLRGWNVAVPV